MHGAAMESNHPPMGSPPAAGFEDRMGHQTPAAPRCRVAAGVRLVALARGRDCVGVGGVAVDPADLAVAHVEDPADGPLGVFMVVAVDRAQAAERNDPVAVLL